MIKNDRIIEIHSKLTDPSLKTKEMFSLIKELKELTYPCSELETSNVLLDERIIQLKSSLNASYARQGYLTEKRRVECFFKKKNKINLEDYESYHLIHKRIKYEMQSVEMVNGSPLTNIRCLFVGSGPLPLSAILFAREYNISTVCIDKNEEAIEISRKLIKILGLEHLVTVQKCEAQMVQDCKEFNLVCIAGMVGKDTVEKTKIINYLSKKVLPGTIFLIRSAEGLRQLLYAPVDIHNIPLIDFCIKIVPMDIIENSLLVGKKIEKMIKQ